MTVISCIVRHLCVHFLKGPCDRFLIHCVKLIKCVRKRRLIVAAYAYVSVPCYKYGLIFELFQLNHADCIFKLKSNTRIDTSAVRNHCGFY